MNTIASTWVRSFPCIGINDETKAEMITSAAHYGWPGDVVISNLDSAGLPAPSIVRPAKIATIDAPDAARLGRLPASGREPLRLYLRERFNELV